MENHLNNLYFLMKKHEDKMFILAGYGVISFVYQIYKFFNKKLNKFVDLDEPDDDLEIDSELGLNDTVIVDDTESEYESETDEDPSDETYIQPGKYGIQLRKRKRN